MGKSFLLFLGVAFFCSCSQGPENMSLALGWQQCPLRPLGTVFSHAESPGCLEADCKVLKHCAYSRPWRFEMLGISVNWVDSAVFLTLQLPTGAGAPSARQGFVLIAQSWGWWVAGLICRARCRVCVACSDDSHLGFASCWIPVKTHLSWLSEHALWGEGQWWVWWAKGIVFYHHWCSVVKFLMQKINFLEIGGCFALCSRLYFYHFKKKAWIELLWFTEMFWK